MASKDLIHQVIDDPEKGKESLDDLFEMLDSEDRETGLEAAMALSLVGSRHPETLDSIAAGLSKREGPATSTALSYLGEEYPERFEEVGGAGSPGGGLAPRQTIDTSEPLEDELDRIQSSDEEDEGEGEELDVGGGGGEVEELFEVDEGIYLISDYSKFDELEVIRHERWGRYSDIYRAAARSDGEEMGVALRVLNCAEGKGRGEFLQELDEALGLWEQVGDHENAIEVYDWGTEPRPWMVTDIFERDLEWRGAVEPGVLSRDLLGLADAISYAHDRGVIHYGIDPENVVYMEDDLGERLIPKLDNFGLMNVYKGRYQGSSLLDPRYAAPEYFDGDYGSPGIHTDIYQFGAITFRMATGRPPFEGSLAEVRTEVLEGDVPRVSGFNPGLPLGLDGVVRKAMSKQKLTRYESMDAVRGDLRRVLGGGGG